MATVIDLATPDGHRLAARHHMRTSLVTDALDMALTHGRVQPGPVFHSENRDVLGYHCC